MAVGFTCAYSWRVPSELADEYRVTVKMTAGPFAIDEKHTSVITKASLGPQAR